MADGAKIFSSGVHGPEETSVNRLPTRWTATCSTGRGNAIDAVDAGLVCLGSLGEGLSSFGCLSADNDDVDDDKTVIA